ncbi:hypothetical protein CBS147347_11416 [Aspergillus niger]|nr:hypothetical protein CBS147347_11416 [Aspergillus niger]
MPFITALSKLWALGMHHHAVSGVANIPSSGHRHAVLTYPARSAASEVRFPASAVRSPASETRSPASETRSPASETRSPASETRSPASATRSPASGTQASDRQNRDLMSDVHAPPATTAEGNDLFEFLNLPSDYQTTAALEAVKKTVEPRYHRGLEIMSQYRIPGDDNPAAMPEMYKMSLVVQAGQAVVREDLLAFVDDYLLGWLRQGLWQPLSPDSVASALSMQCSDLVEAELYDDPMAQMLMRRLVWVRLYYWYDEQMKSIIQTEASPRKLGQGVGLDTETANQLLKNAYVSWEQWSNEGQQAARDKLHARKRVGRRWCELVQYLGPGILITCGADMDAHIHKFPPWGTHAVALFVQQCLPSTRHVCRDFETMAKTFLQRGNMDNTTLQEWRSQLNESLVKDAVKEAKGEIQSVGVLENPRLDRDEYPNLTRFIREALASE